MTTELTPDRTDHVAAIHEIVGSIEGDELRRGYIVRQGITLRTCPADMTNLMRHVAALADERDQWQQTAASHMRHIRDLAAERDAAEQRAERLLRLHAADVAIREHCADARIPAALAVEYSNAQRDCIRHDDLDGTTGGAA